MTMLNLPAPVWVATDEALADCCASWHEEDCLALDTEFVRTTTFYPKPGLIQVATMDNCWLIDPLGINDWAPFADLLLAPGVVKVFHACAEDLEVCRRLCGVVPQPLFDSQLAMAMLGDGSSVGFQRAVMGLLGIDLPKEATRSDWLRRPLSDEQIDYATADVYYLRRLYPGLDERLRQKGRLQWLQEDCQRISEAASKADQDLFLAYRKVKLAWKLRPLEQNILYKLAEWREREARLRDVPRNKVADDQTLWNLARYKAKNRDQLHKAGVRSHVLKDSAKEILALINAAQQDPADVWPEVLEKPLSISAGNQMKALKKRVVARAEEADVPAEILASKRVIEALVRADGKELPDILQGWRRQIIGNELAELLQTTAAEGESNDQNNM